MSDKKIAHVGIAVKSLDDWIPYYRDVLGLEYLGSEELVEQNMKIAFFKIGESKIELIAPTSEDSPISKFIEKRGGGIHHLAVSVDDIEVDLSKHLELGSQLIDEKPRIGAHNTKIAFVHPKSTGGALLELCEE
ncbi:MAG: methylmalonyl-CoA epimerase [Candidatus Thorarchaeota archaeon]